MATIIGYIGDLADAIFDVGNDLITFITASGHEIALIPLVVWLLIVAVGAIRKLIQGV